ncbi:uncharacterized protein LOC143274658 [Babylonia areolata]|uniref:uncharacterized protein LOC143274658 n=1 Tax=Babylonia areolata TaxID=304850 RepID=UPI003FD67D28
MVHWSFLLCLGLLHHNVQGEKAFVCPAESGTFPHPDVDTHFFRCVGGEPVLNTCPIGVFVPSQGLCLQITQTSETTAEATRRTVVVDYSPSSTDDDDDDDDVSVPLSAHKTSQPSSTDQEKPAGTDSPELSVSNSDPKHAASQNLSSVSTKGPSSSATRRSVTQDLEPAKSQKTFTERNYENETETSNAKPRISSTVPLKTYGDQTGGVSKSGQTAETDHADNHIKNEKQTAHHQIETSPLYKSSDGPLGKETVGEEDGDTLSPQTASKEDVPLRYSKEPSPDLSKQTPFEEQDSLVRYSKASFHTPRQTASEDLFVCPQESGFFGHPTNCTRFYWCLDKKATPMVCAHGTAFDPDARACSGLSLGTDGCHSHGGPASSAPPLSSRSDVISVSQFVPFFADSLSAVDEVISGSGYRRSGRNRRQADAEDNDNDRQIEHEESQWGQKEEDQPFGDHHDARPEELGSRDLPRFFCPGDGFYADPHDCSVFYHCFNGSPFRHQCQPGTAFDKDKLVCSWPVGRNGCGGMLGVPFTALQQHRPEPGTGNLPSDNFRCPDEMSGFYPHPEDCTVFFRCIEGTPYRQQCGSGTAFNRERNVCSWPLDLDTGCGAVLQGPSPDGSGLLDSEEKDPSYRMDDGRNQQSTKRTALAKDIYDQKGTEQIVLENNVRSQQGTKQEVLENEVQAQLSTKRPIPAKNTQDNPRTEQENPADNDTTLQKEGEDDGDTSPSRPYQEEMHYADQSMLTKNLASAAPHEPLPKTTRGSFLIKLHSKDSPKTTGHKNFPGTDQYSVKDLGTNPDQLQEDKYRARLKNSPNSASQYSDLATEANGTLQNDSRVTSSTALDKDTSTTLSTLHITAETKLNDQGMVGKKKKSSIRTISWPWEKVEKKKHRQNSKTPTQRIAGKNKLIKQTATAMATPSSTPIMERTMTIPSKRPSASMDTVVSRPEGMTADSTGQSEHVRAETYRVVALGTDFHCPSRAGHFRDPLNCAVYYHCLGGVAYRRDCPNGKLYDVRRRMCRPALQVLADGFV